MYTEIRNSVRTGISILEEKKFCTWAFREIKNFFGASLKRICVGWFLGPF